jgi:glycosyltransferase involved in cell wall biosynthesis
MSVVTTLESALSPRDPAERDSLAVSVIVPTYCSDGAGLARVVSSLDAQSLPRESFEVLFVDDGSPDDTVQRLLEIASTRPFVRVTSIDNSGWPSRPRNVGLRMARGEYVVFMDHDDILFSDALADALGFARAHGLDALSAKEVKTSSRFFTWRAFQHDVARPEKKEPLLLSPMTPHKMYRREYLLANDIFFPEGRPGERKVQWEDIHFNLDVYTHTDRLGVLASRPFYHWVVGHGSNSSSSFTSDPDDFWRHLERIYVHLEQSGMDEASADWIRAGQYSNRVLQSMLGPKGLTRDPAYYERALELAEGFVARYVPDRVDALLDPVTRARSALLRARRPDLVRVLAEHDRGVRAQPVATEVSISGGALSVSVEATWTGRTGEPMALRREARRLYRVVPDPVAAVMPVEILDVTDAEEQATVDLTITGRDSKLGWPVVCDGRVQVLEEEDGLVVRATARGVIDPSTAAFGHRLSDELWEVACRCTFAGFASHPLVQYDGPPLAALADGRLVVAFASSSGRLLLDVGGRRRSVLSVTRPDLQRVTLRRARDGHQLVVPLIDLQAVGSTHLPVTVRLRSEHGTMTAFAGEFVGDDQGCRLVVAIHGLGRGSYRVLVDDKPSAGKRGHVRVTPMMLHVGWGGRAARVRLALDAPARPRRPVWGTA